MFNKLQHYSIRKLTVGVASVLVGVTCLGVNTHKVQAAEKNTNDNNNTDEQVIKSNSKSATISKDTDQSLNYNKKPELLKTTQDATQEQKIQNEKTQSKDTIVNKAEQKKNVEDKKEAKLSNSISFENDDSQTGNKLVNSKNPDYNHNTGKLNISLSGKDASTLINLHSYKYASNGNLTPGVHLTGAGQANGGTLYYNIYGDQYGNWDATSYKLDVPVNEVDLNDYKWQTADQVTDWSAISSVLFVADKDKENASATLDVEGELPSYLQNYEANVTSLVKSGSNKPLAGASSSVHFGRIIPIKITWNVMPASAKKNFDTPSKATMLKTPKTIWAENGSVLDLSKDINEVTKKGYKYQYQNGTLNSQPNNDSNMKVSGNNGEVNLWFDLISDHEATRTIYDYVHGWDHFDPDNPMADKPTRVVQYVHLRHYIHAEGDKIVKDYWKAIDNGEGKTPDSWAEYTAKYANDKTKVAYIFDADAGKWIEKSKLDQVKIDPTTEDDDEYIIYVDVLPKADSKKVTRTIHYVVKGDNAPTAPADKVQTVTLTRSGHDDPNIGEMVWGDWTSDNFDLVKSPELSGYTPDKVEVAKEKVTSSNKDEEVTVTYTKNNNPQPVPVPTPDPTPTPDPVDPDPIPQPHPEPTPTDPDDPDQPDVPDEDIDIPKPHASVVPDDPEDSTPVSEESVKPHSTTLMKAANSVTKEVKDNSQSSTPETVKPHANELPQTGKKDASGIIGLGMALMLGSLGMAKSKKRKN